MGVPAQYIARFSLSCVRIAVGALIYTNFIDGDGRLHLILRLETAGGVTQQECLGLYCMLTLVTCGSLRYLTAIELVCARLHGQFVVPRLLILIIVLFVIQIQIFLIPLVIISTNDNPSPAC